MDDLISRQAALYSYQEVCNKVKCSECKATNEDGDCKLERWIKELPSAERRGRWVIRDDPRTEWYEITCSECGENVTSTAPCIGFFPVAKVTWDYCPYCGAKMEE